jgi:hypothetical protein
MKIIGCDLHARQHTIAMLDSHTIIVFESLMDSKSLFLTPNTETVYAMTWLDLTKGPVVVESPPNVLGMVDDFWFRYVTDLGNAGPDKGKGGKFLFLPPGYKGDVPQGYFVFRSSTFGNIMFWRDFVLNGSTKPAIENFQKNTRMYLLSEASNPPKMKFVNTSGVAFNTVHANNFKFYEEVNEIVQEEPTEAQDPELLGQLAAIGIVKGKEFAPDDRMKKILIDSVAVANATARAISFNNRSRDLYFYPGKSWFNPFAAGSYLWLRDGARLLDARTMFFYGYTAVTPAMAIKMVGVGSQYAMSAMDSQKNYLDGSKTYKLTLPPNPPTKQFWSIVVYDPQTRAELQTDQRFPSISSQNPNVAKNADGSFDIYFGPSAPAGKENNSIQTVPGKGFWLALRLYGPLQPWFDQTWQPGELELVK